MDKIPNFKSFKRAQRWHKARRERRAVEAIIAGIMRGFDKSDWEKAFKKVDELDRQKQIQRNLDIETDSWKIF